MLVILGFMSSVTGRKALALPPTIENIDPVRGAVRVPAQTEVFVDLLAGYTGVLVIDDIELETVDQSELGVSANQVPGQQVTLPPTTIYEKGNATLTFVPTKGAKIESFTQGTHTATVDLLEAHRIPPAVAVVHLDVLRLLEPTSDREGCRCPAARRTRPRRGSARRALAPW